MYLQFYLLTVQRLEADANDGRLFILGKRAIFFQESNELTLQ